MMTTKEIKTEIQRLLDNVPEEVLKNLLEYLQQAQKNTKEEVALSNHLKKILDEDKELLQKLAQ